jgi:hypothetical protein
MCALPDSSGAQAMSEAAAHALLVAQSSRSHLWPHHVGASPSGFRSHVACFADQVYPIHALSYLNSGVPHNVAVEAASACARAICQTQGPAGQWPWHYDVRTGQLLDPYPVYSVHQHAMAPMALRALREFGGVDCRSAIERGLAWLGGAPELDGASLIDERHGFAWRKVGRREPRKLTRRLQAAASVLHPGLRVPGVDALFPPCVIDYECRPYEIGWMLYAWRRMA